MASPLPDSVRPCWIPTKIRRRRFRHFSRSCFFNHNVLLISIVPNRTRHVSVSLEESGLGFEGLCLSISIYKRRNCWKIIGNCWTLANTNVGVSICWIKSDSLGFNLSRLQHSSFSRFQLWEQPLTMLQHLETERRIVTWFSQGWHVERRRELKCWNVAERLIRFALHWRTFQHLEF